MTRMLFILLIGFILLSACRRSSKNRGKDGPCDGMAWCDYDFSPPLYRFKITEPGTGHDLVYGPFASIPPDSIKIQLQDSLYPARQSIDPVRKTTVLMFSVSGDETLYIGRPGKAIRYKMSFLVKETGCCNRDVYSLRINGNPVSEKRDAEGIFLIPVTL